MEATAEPMVNGVKVHQLKETICNIEKQPALGRCVFRARNRWITGGHNRSSIKGFYAAGAEDTRRAQAHLLEADEPEILVGEDHGANPVEYVLHALAACLTTSLVYHAATRGITVEAVESELEGDLDIRGFMGLAPDVRKGYQNIRATFAVTSDAPAELLKELCQFSPVFDTLSNGVPVSIEVNKK